MFDMATVIGFAGSLAILAMLAVAYGTLYRRLPSRQVFDPLMGLLFGLVAVIQMYSPIEPYPGLIIDMRCVPVVLAGAFLGGRGLLPCLLVATVARFDIGGVGMTAGLAGLLSAGAAGLLWQGLMATRRRGWPAFGALGVLSSVHLIGVVLLPTDLAGWFLREAAPTLILLNAVSVPVVAALLEREQRRIRYEDRLARAASFTEGEGLMGREALTWALAQASETGSLLHGATVVAVRMRFRGAVARFWGGNVDRVAMRVLGDRLTALLPEGGVIGAARDDLVLMALPRTGPDVAQTLAVQIRRDVSAEPISQPGLPALRLVLDVDVKRYDAFPGLAAVVSDVSPSREGGKAEPPSRRARAGAAFRQATVGGGRAAGPVARGSDTDLFATFDRLRHARYGSS